MQPLFSILHTSARPEKWREIYDAWIKAAVNPEQVEYVLCVDERWGFKRQPELTVEWKTGDPAITLENWELDRDGLNELVWNNDRRCYVDGVNTAAKASTGRILIVNADDQHPCEGWDLALLGMLNPPLGQGPTTQEAAQEYYRTSGVLDRDFVIEVSTGTPDEHVRRIMVMPILSRARYERLGYVFYPEYESMFADNEFCEHAIQDGVIIDARHLMFPHRHPMLDGQGGWKQPSANGWEGWDPAYQAQNDRRPGGPWDLGQAIFERRQAQGFPPLRKEALAINESSTSQNGHERAASVTEGTTRPVSWLEKAESIQGWMTRAELEWLHDAAAQMSSVVEIGSWKGRSTIALASGCKGNVYAVDHFMGSNEPEHIAEVMRLGGSTFPAFKENIADYPTVIPVAYASVPASKIVPDVDMVFIDGSHDYESVKLDLETWKPKAIKLICGHDADFPDVKRAVEEVLGPVQRGPDGLWLRNAEEQRRIVLCFPGEYFRRQWMRAAVVLGIYLKQRGFLVALADEYTSNPYVTREEILQQIKVLQLRSNDLLLWLDDDNVLDTEQFSLLLSDLDARPDIDGVAGWCWIHNDATTTFQISAGEFTADMLHWLAFNPRTFPKEREPIPMECGGFPCVLMRYSAIEKAGTRPFLPILDERMTHGLSGEDHSFWYHAYQGGARFLVDPRVEVPHFKYMKASPQFPEENAPVDTVACMMRVKNEARWITKAIESVRELCGDYIYVMEDGSTDGTPELVKAAGAHLIHSPFAGEELDERRDKNWLMRYVKEKCNPDWILHIDGDEALEPGGCRKLRLILRGNPAVDILGLRFVNLWDRFDTARIDGVYRTMVRQSLFRPLPDFEFKSYYEGEPGHNHVGLHTSNAPYSQECHAINVFLLHFGYVYREDRIRKYRWITRLDPDNKFEDYYRHTVIGDLPEFPKDSRFKHGGPLELRRIPSRMVPKFDKEPGPAVVSGSAVEVSA